MSAENGAGNGAVMSRSERRAAILGQAGVLAEAPSHLPGPNGTEVPVLVRELTGTQAREFEEAIGRGAEYPLGLLLQFALVDPESKEALFEAADRASLEALGMVGLRPVVTLIKEMSGLESADVDAAKRSLETAPSTATT